MDGFELSEASIRKVHSSADMADIFAGVHHLPFAAFLDSSLTGKRGRFSVIATHPSLVLERREGRCFCNGKACKDSFEQALRTHLAQRRRTDPTNLPFLQGALGYFSYDYGHSLEHIKSRHKPRITMPEARMVFYDRLIVKDAATNNLFLIVQGHRKEATQVLDNLEHHIRHAQRFSAPQKATARASFSSSFSRQEYVETIERLIGYMRKGHCYVANLTQQLTVISTAAPFEVYRYLHAHNPAPFSAFLNYPDVRVVCSSPERFMRTNGAEVETCPIKGTLPRGAQALEDQNLRRALQNSSKDLSELLMTVDLQRNDLNRVCVPGSVKVSKHASVEEYATVFHLASTIQGRMADDKDAIDLISATFPGGSITGAPKHRAMEIIDELEHEPRGLYTGSIGYLSADGTCDLNIVIRTALEQSGVYHLGVGGGITCESNPDSEYEETLLKAAALLEAIKAAEDHLPNSPRA